MDDEVALGGNMSGAVRVGQTVRRRAGYWTPSVHALLGYLAQNGFEAPRPLGIDARGREALSWVEGQAVPGWPDPFPGWIFSPECLRAAAQRLRRFHDLVEGFDPPAGARWRMPAPGPHEIICHNDWAPYNALFRDRRPDVMVDWDMAGPGTRLWDASWTAYMWIPLGGRHAIEYSLERSADRIRTFCADYGDLSPAALLDALLARLRFSATFAREQAAAGDPGFQKLSKLDAPGTMERHANELARLGLLRDLLQ